MKEHPKPGLLKSLFGGQRDAPARARLPLHIPVLSRPDKPLALDTEALIEGLLRQDAGPVTLFTEIGRLLDRINPLALPPDQRARVSHILLSELNDAIGALFPRFIEQGSGVPETREQREGISLAVRAVEQLAISYKLVFQDDYAALSSDMSKRERLTVVTLRIMELIRLEQMLRAFRYQQLPQHVWRDCNQLFFSARSFADVRTGHALKLRIANRPGRPERGLFPELASIEQVYLSVQITGLIDVVSWPAHLVYVVDRYLAELDPPLATQRDHGDGLDAGHVIVYRNQGVPPRFVRSADELGDAVQIDLRPFIEHADADRRVLGADADAAASEPIRELAPQERLPLLELLLRKLGPERRREPRRTVFEPRDARVYGGFDGVYRQLYGQTGRSVLPEVAPAAEPPAPPRWIVANESDGGVQLRIQESQYAMPLHVGRLVAYTLGGDDQFRIGYVTRLQRVGDGEVEVAIARLRETAAAVVVEELGAAEPRALPALLIRDGGGHWLLLCERRHGLAGGAHVGVLADGHTHTGLVGEAYLTKPEFVVFRLHTGI